MRLPRNDDLVVSGVVREDANHRVNVVGRKAPIALHVDVAEHDVILQAEGYPCHRGRDLARQEGLRPPPRLVVVEDRSACVPPAGPLDADHVVRETPSPSRQRDRAQRGALRSVDTRRRRRRSPHSRPEADAPHRRPCGCGSRRPRGGGLDRPPRTSAASAGDLPGSGHRGVAGQIVDVGRAEIVDEFADPIAVAEVGTAAGRRRMVLGESLEPFGAITRTVRPASRGRETRYWPSWPLAPVTRCRSAAALTPAPGRHQYGRRGNAPR